MVPIICYLIGFIIIGNTLILLILLLIKYFLKYNFSYIFFIIPGGIIYLISIELYIEFLLYYEEKYV